MYVSQIYSPFLIEPQKLLVLERLDIAVKWRFFRYLYLGIDPDSERLYRWHIEKRTGGNEPHSNKNNIEDYISGCKSLLFNMKENGFSPHHPIEYGKNGKLRAGAHRIACALLLGLRVHHNVVPVDGTATWGEDWFLRHKISHEDLQKIKSTLTSLKGEYEQDCRDYSGWPVTYKIRC